MEDIAYLNVVDVMEDIASWQGATYKINSLLDFGQNGKFWVGECSRSFLTYSVCHLLLQRNFNDLSHMAHANFKWIWKVDSHALKEYTSLFCYYLEID